jgi:surface carbohydrate biosynthesis protein
MSKYDHTVLNHYPIGSLRLGIHDKFMKTNSKELYDIGIVSQYRKHEISSYRKGEITDHDVLEKIEAQTLMHKLLFKYIVESEKKVALIMGPDKDDEKDYYKEFYHDRVTYLANNYERLSSFDALRRCNIVVGFFSSLIIEAFGLGKKILRIDFTRSDNWNDYDPMILLKNPSYEELKERLNQLFAMPYETYKKQTEKYASYLMNYNPDCPPHMFIRKKIEEYI